MENKKIKINRGLNQKNKVEIKNVIINNQNSLERTYRT